MRETAWSDGIVQGVAVSYTHLDVYKRQELVNNVTNRMRSAFKPKRASDESVALGREKAADATVEMCIRDRVRPR